MMYHSFYTGKGMGRNVRKCTVGHVCLVKIQIRLCDQNLHRAHLEYPVMYSSFLRTTKTLQTAQIRRLIEVFFGHKCQKLRFFTLRSYVSIKFMR